MNIAVYLLFSIIIVLSAYQIFIDDRRSFSINKMLWFYVLLFWGIAPLIQYSIGIFNWDIQITEKTAFKSNLLILLFLLCYKFAYKKILKKDTIDQNTYITNRFQLTGIGIYLLLTLQFLIFAFYVIKGNGLVFLRGEANELVIANSMPLVLITEQVSRAFSTFVAFFFLWMYRQDKSSKNAFFLIFSLTLMLLTNFPLALPRYMAGAFYIGILFISRPIFKHKSLPVMVLIFVLVIVFPALSVARYVTNFSEMEVTISIFKAFTSGDFDNFSTLNMAVLYVEKNGITFGEQLLGVILFFIPRSVWPSKPVGSGHHMAIDRSMSFTNLSCPMVAEGYINFGYIGIILFALVLGLIAAKIDYRFYHFKRFSIIHLMYPMLLGLIIFILRGDLMSSWAYTVSFIVAAALVMGISKPFLIHDDTVPIASNLKKV